MALNARTIKIFLDGDVRGLNDALGQAQTRTQKFGKALKVGALAAVGGLAAGIAAGFKGVLDGVEAEAQLKDSLSRSSQAMRDQEGAIKAAATQLQQKTKFSYEDGLAIAANIAKNQSLSGVIDRGAISAADLTKQTADLATVLKTDGASAADLLGKALAKPESASRLLTKAGVDLTTAEEDKVKALVKSGKTADAQSFLLDKLKDATEGAADAAGETLPGKIERAKNSFGEMQESLAVALLPAFQAVTDAGLKLSAWAEANPGKMRAIVVVVAALAAIIGIVSVATTVWTAITAVATAVTTLWTGAMTLLKLAFLTSPIGFIVVLIAGLIAIIVLVATKTQFFQTIWSAVWGAIKAAFNGVFGFIKRNWPLILAILTGPIGLAVLAIVKNWDKIKAGVSAVKDWIVDKFNDVVGFVKGLPGKISSAASGLFDGIKNAFKSAVNFVIGGWNSLRFGIPEIDTHIPGIGKVGGGSFGVPQIPLLAKGGNITRGGTVLVGERGPELLNLGRGAQVTPLTSGGDIYLTVDLGEGIQRVVQIKNDRANRATRNSVMAGSRRSFA